MSAPLLALAANPAAAMNANDDGIELLILFGRGLGTCQIEHEILVPPLAKDDASFDFGLKACTRLLHRARRGEQ